MVFSFLKLFQLTNLLLEWTVNDENPADKQEWKDDCSFSVFFFCNFFQLASDSLSSGDDEEEDDDFTKHLRAELEKTQAQ